jgi:hypothetical protein
MFSIIWFALKWVFGLFAVPVNWFLELSFYDWQLPILVAVAIVIFYRPLSVFGIKSIVNTGSAVADWKFHWKWRTLNRLNDPEYDRLIASLQARADEKNAEAEDYEDTALGSRFRFLPGSTQNLLREAEKCREQSARIAGQIQHYQKLRDELVKRRERQGGLRQLLDILGQLNSDDNREALDALTALNGMQKVDWSAAINARLPPQARDVAVKCLRLMVATTNLHEARSAYARISQILRGHRMSWEDIAA